MNVQCRARSRLRCDATRHQKGCNQYRAPTAEDSLEAIAGTLARGVEVMSAAFTLYLAHIHETKPTKGENQ